MTGNRLTPTRITDPKAVAAITHPLRMRLLGELARCGTARVVDLAQALDEPANSVSFHLRRLAHFGLIEQDPERGNGRERWWRQSSDRGFQIDLEAIEQGEGGAAAVDTLRRVAEGHVLALHRTTRAPRGRSDTPAEVVVGGTLSRDFALHLTDAELRQLADDLDAVLERWSERSRTNEPPPDGDRRRGYYGVVMAAPADEMFRAYSEAVSPTVADQQAQEDQP